MGGGESKDSSKAAGESWADLPEDMAFEEQHKAVIEMFYPLVIDYVEKYLPAKLLRPVVTTHIKNFRRYGYDPVYKEAAD